MRQYKAAVFPFFPYNDTEHITKRAKEALFERNAGVPWDVIKRCVNAALAALNGVSGEGPDKARHNLQAIMDLLAEF